MSVEPYSEEEMDRILAAVPKNRSRVKIRVLHAAQEYLFMLDRVSRKANPPQEISRLELALHSLAQALSALSSSSSEHLADRRDDSPAYEDPMDTWELGIAVHRFLIENKRGLKDKPASPGPGPIAHDQKRLLEKRLKLAFVIGHDDDPPRNGFPKFRDLCIAPAALKLRAMIGDPKKWQDLRRNNPARKSGK